MRNRRPAFILAIRSLFFVFVAAYSVAPAVASAAGWARLYTGAKRTWLKALAPLPGGRTAVLAEDLLFSIDGNGAVNGSIAVRDNLKFFATGPAGGVFAGSFDVPLPGQGAPNLTLYSFGPDLKPRWARSYVLPAAPPYFDFHAADGTSDGGVIVIGDLLGGESGTAAAVFRFAADGTFRWGHLLNLSGSESLLRVRATREGGCVAAGSNDDGGWIVKLAADGAVQWQKTLTGTTVIRAVTETTTGDIIAAGTSARRMAIVKFDAGGKITWARESTAEETALSIAAAPSGGIVVLSQPTGKQPGVAIARVSANGDLLWSRFLAPGAPLNAYGAMNLVLVVGDSVIIAPPVLYEPLGQALLFAVDAESGMAECRSLIKYDDALSLIKVPAETLPLTQRTVPLQTNAVEAEFSHPEISGTPYACVQPPAVRSIGSDATPVSDFRGMAETLERWKSYARLLEAKDFAALDVTVNRLRSQQSWPDPLMSPLVDLHNGLDAADLDDATRIASFREWIQHRPDSVVAKVGLVEAIYNAAWRRRGTGFNETVTDTASEEYSALMREARHLLDDIGNEGDWDPMTWRMRIQVGYETGGADVEALARRAVAISPDPTILTFAASYLHPKWGGSLSANRLFAEKAVEWTKGRFGSGMYAWLAYQAWFNRTGTEYEKFGFDWERTATGFRDLIKRDPTWLPLWHRFAFMASRLEKRPVARELFGRHELDWYEEAQRIWSTREAYLAARQWALHTPAEPFMQSQLDGRTSPAAGAAPPPPARVPASKLKPSSPQTGSGLSGTWPQIVMQSELQLTASKVQLSAFLLETTEGIVAVSAVPARPERTDSENAIREIQRQTQKWTMWSPARPKTVMEVASFETANSRNYQSAVALAIKPFQGDLPVHPLKTRPAGSSKSGVMTTFAIACKWTGNVCQQRVLEGKIAARDSSGIIWIGLRDTVDVPSLRGAPVVDEDGYVIAVMTGRSSGMSAEYATTAAADSVELLVGK